MWELLHKCCTANFFISLKIISIVNVPLSDQTQIIVTLYGNVKLTPQLLLKDVSFIPKFKINLFSISAFTRGSQLTVQCLPNSFAIKDLQAKTMIT